MVGRQQNKACEKTDRVSLRLPLPKSVRIYLKQMSIPTYGEPITAMAVARDLHPYFLICFIFLSIALFLFYVNRLKAYV